jgi:hypothetical protein
VNEKKRYYLHPPGDGDPMEIMVTEHEVGLINDALYFMDESVGNLLDYPALIDADEWDKDQEEY